MAPTLSPSEKPASVMTMGKALFFNESHDEGLEPGHSFDIHFGFRIFEISYASFLTVCKEAGRCIQTRVWTKAQANQRANIK